MNQRKKPMIVTNNTSAKRFEASWEDQTVWLDYDEDSGVYSFTHTEVPDGGDQSALVDGLTSQAFEEVRALGGRIIPLCPLTQEFVQRNPMFRGLVVSSEETKSAGGLEA